MKVLPHGLPRKLLSTLDTATSSQATSPVAKLLETAFGTSDQIRRMCTSGYVVAPSERNKVLPLSSLIFRRHARNGWNDVRMLLAGADPTRLVRLIVTVQ